MANNNMYGFNQNNPYGPVDQNVVNALVTALQNQQTNNMQPAQNQQRNWNNWMPNQQPIQQPVQQPVQNHPTLLGRPVDSINDIKNQEVPSNGYRALFPTNDGEEIIVKYLDNDCDIKTIRYVKSNEESSCKKDPLEEILVRLDKLESSITDIKENKNQQKHTYNNRKE